MTPEELALRDQFALALAPAFVSLWYRGGTPDPASIAELAYAVADAMVVRRGMP